MMKPKLYCLGFVLAVVLVFSGIAMSAPAKPTTVAELALYRGADRQQILEEGAKKEGKLMFYTSGILKQAVNPIVDTFQKKYPYIKVEIWRGGADTLAPRIIEEHRAGKLLCDVVEGTNTTQFVLQREGISQPFYSPSLAYINEGAITNAPGGDALAAGFREQGTSLGYNTKLLRRDQAPKTYRDLLDPKWKDKMAICGSDTGQRSIGTMLVANGEDFLKQLVKQNIAVHMVSARALLDMVINGEYPLSPTITDAHVESSKQTGAPCEWVPLEPVSTSVGQIALPKTSTHPHAAMLFIDFELSKESAEIHKKLGYTPSRKDIPGATTYRKFYNPRSLEEAVQWDALFERLFMRK